MTTQIEKNPLKIPAKNSRDFPLTQALKDYAVLRAQVHEVLILGRQRVEKAMMLMRYHTGLLINEHVRLNAQSTAYGTKAILKLEKDFDIDHTELHRYGQFAKAYPIVGGRRQLRFNLTWECYRKLLIIPDVKDREALTAQAEKNEWTFEEVESRVRRVIGHDPDRKPSRLPFVCLGPFSTYQIVQSVNLHSAAKELLLDMGFKLRLEMDSFKEKFPAGTIVTGVRDSRGHYVLKKVRDRSQQPKSRSPVPGDDLLYTYQAQVEEAVDGDTLKLDFHLGLGERKGETIRLNHIDCPELNTPEGKAAKRFVESELAGSEFITVKSVRTKKEKWGRYLVDIFYARKGKGPLIYLNQLLLDEGHAVKFKA